MTQGTFKSSRLLQPARPLFIFGSLLFAFMMNLLPTTPIPLLPDWCALVLCFWAIREPRKVGMGIAFLFGFAMDVGQGSLMGQHALAYVLVAYLGSSLSRRIQWFPVLEQALHVLPILLLAQIIQYLARLSAGADFPGIGFFLSPLIGAALWWPFTFLLLLPQFRPLDRDDNRPI